LSTDRRQIARPTPIRDTGSACQQVGATISSYQSSAPPAALA